MISNDPLVSVLMTAYNREQFIAEAIESVLDSSYSNFELIIVDDVSKDDTVKIASTYANKDNRIKVFINEKNLGDYPNRNKAASYAKGEYLKYIDSDDEIFPGTLQLMVDSFGLYPSAALVISSRYPDMPGKGASMHLTPEEAYRVHFFDKGFLDNGPTAVMIRKSVFEELKGFSGKRNVSDFELWLKIAGAHDVVLVEDGLVYWREHEGQEINIAPDYYIEYQLMIIRESLNRMRFKLTETEIGEIFRKFKKGTIRSIQKDLIKKKDFSRTFHFLKANNLSPIELLSIK